MGGGVCQGEAALPDALEEVGHHVFDDCPEIKTIWVGNSFVANSLQKHSCKRTLPARSTMVGDKLLWDLRKLRDLVIPEGV